MNTVPVRAGLRRGRIEFRQSMTNPTELWNSMFFPVIALVVMFFLRENTVPGTTFSLGTQSIPGILAMNFMFNGLLGLGIILTMEREDGTLLRAKAIPNGTLGYLVGKVTSRAAVTVVGAILPLAVVSLVFDGLRLDVVTLLWVLVLGLVAVLPIGAILGAVFKNAQAMGFMSLVVFLLLAVSGVFYPITALPEWLQWIAQVFPLYWLGLGLRSALLPDSLSAVEIGESWRHLETVGVLGLWAVVGFVFAPMLLRRMARRESGSTVAASRAKAMQRTM
ncbi:ABC transporter permease [Actinocrispum wychmicini]|uniref:Transport permease protein n=1 Tax=Actinocrispum wychmicini TaxID=1213861 RepID=A0A4R2J6G8_9PSEU|nr:ABC transporter permease [Actinocrispum wychmicini]TCO53647.1 ABC-2 type transport system permease protein [Actinocrispum wychmicini]